MTDPLIGATTAVFVIKLSVALTEPVDVAWSTKDGTAKAGIDYQAANGVVTFLPGETEKQIQVTVYGASATDPSKNFYIQLTPPTNAILGNSLVDCIITVVDDEGTAITSVVVAQGKQGLKGDPGISAYEQAVLMGYEGTVQDWMDAIADASQAATRAEEAIAEVEANAAKAEAAAAAAAFSGRIYPTPSAGVDPVTGVPNGAYFNVRSTSNDNFIDEYRNISGVATSTGKSYPTSSFVQEIAEYVPLPYKNGATYDLHKRVTLANGDIVCSTTAGNTNDPNTDMTGWVKKGNLIEVESIAEMLAISTTQDGMRVYVKSYIAGNSTGGGEFTYDADSAETANDVTIFGSGTGRWKRPADEIITPYHAGAVDNTDSTDALERFNAFVLDDFGKTDIAVYGAFQITRPLNLDYRNRDTLDFDLRLTALNPMRYILAVRGNASCTGSIRVNGTGVVNNWASLGVDYGIVINGIQSGKLPSIIANKFKYFGVVMDEGGNIGMPIVAPMTYFNSTCAEILEIVARDCGCSQTSPWSNNNTAYTFSNPVHSGSSGAPSQRTTVSVSGLPFSSSEQTTQAYAVINNITYKVIYVDFTNKTVSLFPWLEINEPVSGSIKFFFGGAYFSIGSSSGPTKIGRIDAIRCATGITEMALYGVNVTSITTQSCAVGAALGRQGDTISPQSSAYIGFYTEAVYRNMTLVGVGSCTVVNRLGDFAGPAFTNCEKIAVNNRVGDYGAFADTIGFRNVFMPSTTDNNLVGLYYKGARLNKDLARASIGLSPRSVVPRIYYKNSWTINIDDPTSANQVKGIDDAIIGFVGTGANAAPTGTFTFNPPSGWKINSGTVDASFAVSGFSGPALFLCYWEIDTKNIIVRQLTQRAASQADSTATDVATLKTDFNALLAKMRAAGLM